jgi:hypothetical protein
VADRDLLQAALAEIDEAALVALALDLGNIDREARDAHHAVGRRTGASPGVAGGPTS